MVSKVNSETDLALKGQLKKINQQRKAVISTREEELKGLDGLYEKKKSIARAEGEAQVADILDRNQKAIVQKHQEKEDRLQGIQKSFQKQKVALDTEKEKLQSFHQEKVTSIDEFYNDKFNEHVRRGEEISRDIDDRAQFAIKKASDEANESIRNTLIKSKFEVAKSKTGHLDKMIKLEREQMLDEGARKIEHKNMMDQAKLDHEKRLSQLDRFSMIETKKIKDRQKQDIANSEQIYKKNLKDKEALFKQKFLAITKGHDDRMKLLETRFKNEMDRVVASHSKIKDLKMAQVNDEFYHLKKLNVKIKDLGKEYLLSIEVPEHEAKNVFISPSDRKIKVSFSRRFTEEVEDKSGQRSTNKRSEVYTQEVSTPDILDSKGVVRKYHDGLLEFKIQKK